MEIRYSLLNLAFSESLKILLDKLNIIYNHSEDKFYRLYSQMPCHLSIFIRNIKPEEYENSELEDLAYLCYEVSGHYLYEREKYLKKYNTSTLEYLKPFTLRNPEDLKTFEIFLDKMLYIYEYSPKHFMDILPQAPLAYWDKIDDLRETSFKFKRDSPDYIRCLQKCKKISFAFSDYADSLLEEEDEEFFDEYENENYDE